MNNAQVQANPSFNPTHLGEKNVQVINTLRKGLKSNIEKCLKEIDSLKSSVSLYRDSIEDFVNLSIEKSDTVSKYSKSTSGGAYNLPGVFALSMGSYDIEAMKADNQRLEQINGLQETAENQKNAYFKMMIRAQNELKIYLNAIARINVDLGIFLEQVSEESSWQSNLKKV